MLKEYQFGVIGNPNVGKTKFVYQAAFGYSNIENPTTIGIGHYKLNINIKGTTYHIDLIDTPGQLSYASFMVSELRKFDAVLLFFDITDPESFDDLSKWNLKIEDYCSSNIVKVLIGHKSDLQEKRLVSKESAQLFAKSNSYDYFEFSSSEDSSIYAIKNCLQVITSKVPPKENAFRKSVYLSSKPNSSYQNNNSCNC